jgi:hypothetical protein
MLCASGCGYLTFGMFVEEVSNEQILHRYCDEPVHDGRDPLEAPR